MLRTSRIRAFAFLIAAAMSDQAAAGEPPPALALVPGDAAGFLSVDLPGLIQSPIAEDLRFALGALKPAELAAFARKFPVEPNAIERLVVVFPTGSTVHDPSPNLHPTAVSALVVASCSKPFDPSRLAKGTFPSGRLKSYRGHRYHFDEDAWSGLLALPGDRTFVVGTEDSLVWLIDRLERGGSGPLAPARAEAASHIVFAAVRPSAIIPPSKLPAGLKPLAEAERIDLAIDPVKTLKVGVKLHYKDAEGSASGAAALKLSLRATRDQLQKAEESLQSMVERPAPGGIVGPGEFPERFAALLGIGMLRRLDELLKELPIEERGTVVRTAFDLPVSSGARAAAVSILGITALGANAHQTFQYVGSSIRPPNSGPSAEELRLKKLAAAFAAYHADHGSYPPAALAAADGTPLLSWRVALLPYLGEKALYSQFHFDEPWDSLHNKTLIAKMPAAFNKPHVWPENYGRTNAQVVTGPGTWFDGLAGKKKGSCEKPTILAVEVGEGHVWWTKPADAAYAPGRLPPLFGPAEWGSCWAVLTDGTVKRLTRKSDAKALPALLLRPKE